MKLIILDYDGLIVDSRDMYSKVISETLKGMGLQASFEEVKSKLVPSIKDTVEEIIPKDIENREKAIIEVVRKSRGLALKNIPSKIKMCKGAKEVLKNLHSRGYKLILLTNTHAPVMEKSLKAFKIYDYFDERIGSENSEYKSKSQEITKLCNKYKIPLSETVYIGDTARDAKTAKEAGCVSIIVFTDNSWDWPDKSKIEKSKPDHIIYSLNDIIQLVM